MPTKSFAVYCYSVLLFELLKTFPILLQRETIAVGISRVQYQPEDRRRNKSVSHRTRGRFLQGALWDAIVIIQLGNSTQPHLVSNKKAGGFVLLLGRISPHLAATNRALPAALRLAAQVRGLSGDQSSAYAKMCTSIEKDEKKPARSSHRSFRRSRLLDWQLHLRFNAERH
ncbi:hypothetical protein CI102_924 [Trichoderma harzianum]|nr:hypothetical protein CI102_924 [Trichoderma harzianum]